MKSEDKKHFHAYQFSISDFFIYLDFPETDQTRSRHGQPLRLGSDDEEPLETFARGARRKKWDLGFNLFWCSICEKRWKIEAVNLEVAEAMNCLFFSLKDPAGVQLENYWKIWECVNKICI